LWNLRIHSFVFYNPNDTIFNNISFDYLHVKGFSFFTSDTRIDFYTIEQRVIDYTNLTAVKDINVGYQPHGLAVDEVKKQVYVANRNTPSGGGPAPHHTSSCGGRNGYLPIIDMNTLNLVPGFKMELSVDPYSVNVRN
jgi:hypothetical protein